MQGVVSTRTASMHASNSQLRFVETRNLSRRQTKVKAAVPNPENRRGAGNPGVFEEALEPKASKLCICCLTCVLLHVNALRIVLTGWNLYVRACMYACMHACMHVCMHMYIHMPKQIHIRERESFVHVYLHLYLHVFMCLCVYIYRVSMQ